MLIPEVSILIPTRNRAHILEQTLPSYICQEAIGEIIIVDDGSTDNTRDVIEKFRERTPVPIRYFKNEHAMGATGSRNVAVEYINMSYAVWGEDDLIFGKHYVITLLEYLKKYKADIVGGRLIYMNKEEDEQQALLRVKNNKAKKEALVDINILEFNFSDFFNSSSPIEVPFLHGIILTKADWLRRLKYDERYGGNGYREETDFQVNVLKHGGKILLCPNTYCFHLHRSYAKVGGQHDRSRLNYEYWTIRNNNYFLNKHYSTLKEKLNLSASKSEMKWIFAKHRVKNLVFSRFRNSLLRIMNFSKKKITKGFIK